MKKPLRLGLIGCGGIVQKTHARAYHSLSDIVKVSAIADIVQENLEKIGDEFNIPEQKRFKDYRDMLTKGEIDVVTIATPHSLHAEQVIEAANAGVAIISEKPMATSMEEADAILEAVNKQNVAYTVVHNYLYNAGMQAAMIELPNLGKTYYGRSTGMGLRGSDFNANHPNPAFAWRASKATGGGCVSDSSYHEIYAVCTLVLSQVLIVGYNFLSFIRASSVLNRQFILVRCSFLSDTHAWTSRFKVSWSGIRLEIHPLDNTDNSISAIFNQLPCFGV